MEWKSDNCLTLATVPAGDDNFTAALGYASDSELRQAHYYLENHTAGNKTRLKAVNREIRRRQKEGKF